MDILNQVVERLTKDELRYLKMSYPDDKGETRKDSLLLDAVRKAGNDFNEEATIDALGYSKQDKNSYYRLKNRVIEDIGDGLTRLYTHKDERLELLHYLSLFQIYYSKSLYRVCLYYLKKTERIANATESYELLENVYDNFIRLSFHLVEINPQTYIELRKQNAVLVKRLRALDDDLADVSYRLKLTQNFGNADNLLLRRLRENANAIATQTTGQYGKSLQTRIYRALSQVFLQSHHYGELEQLVKDSYSLFEKENWFDKNNHELKLQMLTYYANALYKNGKLKDSLHYSELLGKALPDYNAMYYDRYVFFYYNLQVLNYSVINPARALEQLTVFEQLMRKKKNYYYDTFIYLNRSGLLYDMGKYKEALKSLVRLYVSDDYERADKSFKLKVEISELIITFDAGDTDALLHRLEQVKKDYAPLLKQKNHDTDRAIVNLLGLMGASANYRRDKTIQAKMSALSKMKTNSAVEDAEIIKYKGWLERKMS